ncbi:MAG: hypothetical protein ACREEM_38620 [Blastocatellia bacterium]
MTADDLFKDNEREELLKGLRFRRWLREKTTDPFFLLLLIASGPPGWIFIMVGFWIANKRVENLINVANAYVDAQRFDEAKRFANAALSIDQNNKDALKVTDACLKARHQNH